MPSYCPSELRYTATHEWVRLDENGLITVGITDHAQDLLGELVYVELPKIGSDKKVGQETAVLESVKTAADVYAPIAGKIVGINDALADSPSLVNEECYEKGWIFKMEITDTAAFEKLLTAEQYLKANG